MHFKSKNMKHIETLSKFNVLIDDFVILMDAADYYNSVDVSDPASQIEAPGDHYMKTGQAWNSLIGFVNENL